MVKFNKENYTESNCRSGKLFPLDKLLALSMEEAYAISDYLGTLGIQTNVGYNMHTNEWSVAIICLPNNESYKKLSEIPAFQTIDKLPNLIFYKNKGDNYDYT